MPVHRFCITLVIVFVCFTSFSLAPAGGNRPRLRKERGQVHEIDLKVGKITLKYDDDDDPSQTQTFSLAGPNIPVETDRGEKAKLESLKPRHEVELSLSPVGDVVHIRVDAPRIRFNRVKSVDPSERTITLRGDEDTPDRKFAVSKTCEIKIHKKEGNLAGIRPAMDINLVLSLDRTRVNSISAFFRSSHSDGREVVIHAVDPVKHTIQVIKGGHGHFSLVTYPLTPDFRYYGPNGYEQIALSELPTVKSIADLVTAPAFRLRFSNGKLIAIFGRPAWIQGKIASVDLDKRILTLQTGAGYRLAADTAIRFGRETKKLEELTEGLEVGLRMSMDGTKVTRVGSWDDD